MAGRKPALTNAQLKEVQSSIMKGTSPANIASQYKVAVSTIHNIKAELKKQGKKVPAAKRGNPHEPRVKQVDSVDPYKTKIMTGSSETGKFTPIREEQESNETNRMQFIINGVNIIIEPGERQVNFRTTPTGIVIDFK